MGNNKKNNNLTEFARTARKMGLSYGQLQQMETVNLIREGKLGQKKGKKK